MRTLFLMKGLSIHSSYLLSFITSLLLVKQIKGVRNTGMYLIMVNGVAGDSKKSYFIFLSVGKNKVSSLYNLSNKTHVLRDPVYFKGRFWRNLIA